MTHHKELDIEGLLRKVEKELLKYGIRVNLFSKVKGISGIEHDVDLIAEKGDRRVILDVLVSGSLIDEVRMLPLFMKMYDVRPCRTVLIAVPGLTEEAIELAKSCGLEVVNLDLEFNEVVKEIEQAVLKGLKINSNLINMQG